MAPPVLTRSRLAQPARTAARMMARLYLQRVLAEAAGVEIRVEEAAGRGARRRGGRHGEAVHDLRVALRRLRSWLRAFRPLLDDTVRRSSERRLQRLSRLAGLARDLEVQRAWLGSPPVQRARPAGDGARRVLARVETEYARTLAALGKGLLRGLGPAAARLDRELREAPTARARKPPAPRMGEAMAELIAAQAGRLPRILRKARRVGQAAEAHAARIAVKRLRYLMDSLGGSAPALRRATEYFGALQDALGELHDAQVLLARLTDPRAAPSGAGRGSRRALAALRALLRRRMAAEFQAARRAIAGPGLPRALAATGRVVAGLSRGTL